MQKKPKKVYYCTNCGHQTSNWTGQCPECGQWNTMEEETYSLSTLPDIASSKNPQHAIIAGIQAGIKNSDRSLTYKPGASQRLSEITHQAKLRISSGMTEVDRVLGGGFVPGQVVLLAGDPGIGKSTLLINISQSLITQNIDIYYVCGEESAEQIKLRAERMKYSGKNMIMIPESNIEEVIGRLQSEVTDEYSSDSISQVRPKRVVVVDSIQTIYSYNIAGLAGSITQVRNSSQLLTIFAKKFGIPIIIVGHVTKEGEVAGPKILEHIVDTVMYLEGDSQHLYRVLKTTKNRFGPVSEVGIFEMKETGMVQVANPSEIFISEAGKENPGSCVTVVMEGERPILFEVQALTVKTNFGYPKRTSNGFNVNRLQLLLAILEKRCNLPMSNYDVYLNVAGGYKITEYASDLAVCVAVASALKDKSIPRDNVVFGECGLGGEVRRVIHQERRYKELLKLGYKKSIGPVQVKSVKSTLSGLGLL